MNAIDVIDRLAQAGFDIGLSPNAGNLLVTPPGLPDDLRTLIRDHKPAILAHLSDALPIDAGSGSPFMPWCASLPAEQFVKWRGELLLMIEELASLEGWERQHLDDVCARAINGPVSDLRPNWHYFAAELRQSRQQRDKRMQEADQARRATEALFNRRP